MVCRNQRCCLFVREHELTVSAVGTRPLSTRRPQCTPLVCLFNVGAGCSPCAGGHVSGRERVLPAGPRNGRRCGRTQPQRKPGLGGARGDAVNPRAARCALVYVFLNPLEFVRHAFRTWFRCVLWCVSPDVSLVGAATVWISSGTRVVVSRIHGGQQLVPTI